MGISNAGEQPLDLDLDVSDTDLSDITPLEAELNAIRAPAATTDLLRGLSTLTQTQLLDLVIELGDVDNPRFIELAQKPDPAPRDIQLLDAARWLQQHCGVLAGRISEEFTRSVQRARNAWATSAGGDVRINSSALSLLDDAEMEESLAVANLAHKGESAHHDQLAPLLQRLNNLVAGFNFTEQSNPFGPHALAQVLRVVLMDFKEGLTPEQRLGLFKLFEQFLIPELGMLYSQLNAKLAESGVLPNLHVTHIVRHDSRERSRPSRKQADSSAGSPDNVEPAPESARETNPATQSSHVSGNHPHEIFEELQRLVSTQRGKSPASASSDGAPGQAMIRGGYELSSLLTAVSLFQSSNPSADGIDAGPASPMPTPILDFAQIKQQLATQLATASAANPVALSQLDEDTIDIVGNLFEAILDDPHLAEPIKAQIARLQIPLLKVALMDRTFFVNTEHPARRLVDRLAEAGAGWIQDENYREDPLYCKITALVARVIAEFDRDLDLFSVLLAELNSQQTSNQTHENALRERLQTAHAVTQEAIEAHLAAGDVPQGVAEFCRTAWSRYLIRIHETEGAQGTAWENALDVLKNLLWSVQPKLEITEKRLMAMMIPQLLIDLELGMAAIEYAASDIQAFLQLLQDIHLNSLRGKKATKDGSGVAANSASPATAATASAEEIEAVARLGSLPLGTWIQVRLEDGKCKRGRLVWRDVFTQELTFADWRFKVIIDAKTDVLAKELVNNRLQILAGGPLIDRAIAALMKKLKTIVTKTDSLP